MSKSIYQAFDFFMGTETWYKDNRFDNEVFFLALHEVVKDPAFNPDTMAAYMRSKVPDDPEHMFYRRIDQLREWAWGIKDYLATHKL
jgi:hypothetical protein